MTCQTHPVLCPGKACPDSAECKRLQRKVFKPCKHTCKHGKGLENHDLALLDKEPREAGKAEGKIRCFLLGGLYSKIGRIGRIRLPDVSSIRKRL